MDENLDADGNVMERAKEGLKIAKIKDRRHKTDLKREKTLLESAQSEDRPTPDANAEESLIDSTTSTSTSKKAKLERRKEKKDLKKAKKAVKEFAPPKQEAGRKTGEKNHPLELVINDVAKLETAEPKDVPLLLSAETAQYQRSPPSHSSLSPPESPIFDASNRPSASSSTSSYFPPSPTTKPIKQSIIPSNSEELRARLEKKLSELRARRKADGPDGSTARNRQELVEERRRKEEQRQARKKELRLKAREEERQRREVALTASLQNPPLSWATGSNASPLVRSPLQMGAENNFSFGRLVFEDGQQVDSSLTKLLDCRKRKGPSDPHSALQAAESKRQRLAGLDESKRTDIEEKDRWLNARKRVYGEKVRDDTSLLRKTLKRKEKLKKRSEHEWNGRIEGVEKGKEIRQKKREDNLRKRREERGNKGKKPSGKKATKKSSRPGFEGSFRAKHSTK